MDYCSICKSRNTWDCEDERKTGRTKCDNFELDFNAIPDEIKCMAQDVALMFRMRSIGKTVLRNFQMADEKIAKEKAAEAWNRRYDDV